MPAILGKLQNPKKVDPTEDPASQHSGFTESGWDKWLGFGRWNVTVVFEMNMRWTENLYCIHDNSCDKLCIDDNYAK